MFASLQGYLTMGQCIATAATNYPDDDDLSIATYPHEPNNSCKSPSFTPLAGCNSPSSDPTPDSNINSNSNINKVFLKIHKTDRACKCILDPSQVYKALEMQTEEMLIRDNPADEQDNQSDDEDISLSGTSSEAATAFFSEVAQSEITAITTKTTDTCATRPAGNLDKHTARKRKTTKPFSVVVNIDGGGRRPVRAPSKSGNDVKKKDAAAAERDLEQRRALKWRIAHIRQRHRERIEEFMSYAEKIDSYFQPPPVVSERRGDYMSVLHLTMKANLAGFYQQRFLPLFPNSPTPPGLSSKSGQSASDELPDLSSASSDTSSSASGGSIEFGAIPPSSPIRLLANDSVFMDLAITGSLGLVPRVRARKVLPPRDNQKSSDHYTVLLNRRSGVPLAVCALKSPTGPPVVRIYATKQRVLGQRPAATTMQLGLEWTSSYPLYAWAEIVADGEFPSPVNYSMYLASGSKGRFSATPSYQAAFLANGSPDIKVVGRTDKERDTTGCALISIKNDGSGENPCFHLDISQGIDPALLICFAAVVDEAFECSMRLQCKSHEPPTFRSTRTGGRMQNPVTSYKR
jgi:hypothetical protein